MTDAGPSANVIQAVRDAARRNAPDRYYAALLASSAQRDDLVALAAFTGEIEHVTAAVTEPLMGEIRIQWWRDALKLPTGERTGSPIADAFIDVVRRRSLARGDIEGYLDAHAAALAAPPENIGEELRYAEERELGPFRLAAAICDVALDEAAAKALRESARAYGIARYAYAQWGPMSGGGEIAEIAEFTARSNRALAAFRSYKPLSTGFLTAMLPVALVEPYLQALKSVSLAPPRNAAAITPLRRMWCLAKAYMTGRI